MSVQVVSENRPVGRRFGLTWFLQSTDYGDGDGEVQFQALETSVFGGGYFVIFDEGQWWTFEMGGVGPDVWDYVLGEEGHDSPLSALREVGRYDRETRRLIAVHEAAGRAAAEIIRG